MYRKKCLFCGYWKVYNDSSKAKKIFNQYDEIKEYTIKPMLKGNNSRDLAFSIKDFSILLKIKYIHEINI